MEEKEEKVMRAWIEPDRITVTHGDHKSVHPRGGSIERAVLKKVVQDIEREREIKKTHSVQGRVAGRKHTTLD